MNNKMDKHAQLNIRGDVTGTQIQQFSNNSSQTISLRGDIDYKQLSMLLEEIKSKSETDEFKKALGENADQFNTAISTAYRMIKEKDEPRKIQHVLELAKDIGIGITGSLIASGIVSLITQLITLLK